MHVLLADESNRVRGALKLYLEQLQSNIKVSQAEAFHEALDLAASAESVDLIILDLHMPGANGLAGFDIMRARFPQVPVVLMSGRVRREEVLEALGRGAAGFIPKTLNGRALLGALQLVLAGEKFIPSLAVSEGDAKRADGPNGLPTAGAAGGPLSKLTPRERDVLALLNKGYSTKEIAHRLNLQPMAVASHLKGVFRKLGATDQAHAVTISMQLGFGA